MKQLKLTSVTEHLPVKGITIEIGRIYEYIGSTSSAFLVLCTDYNSLKPETFVGTVISDNSPLYNIGSHSTDWSTDYFKLFTGRVTLEQL